LRVNVPAAGGHPVKLIFVQALVDICSMGTLASRPTWLSVPR
jgi:hypothetical protein